MIDRHALVAALILGGGLALAAPSMAQTSSPAPQPMVMPPAAAPAAPAQAAPPEGMKAGHDMPMTMEAMKMDPMMMEHCKAMGAEMRALRAEIAALRADLSHRHSRHRAGRAAVTRQPQAAPPAPSQPAPSHQHIH